MKKAFWKRLYFIIPMSIFLVFLIVLAFVAFTSIAFVSRPNDVDFSSIIRDNVPLSANVIDIAMLGAHNSFSHLIHRSSDIDPNEEPGIATSFVRHLAPGTISRFGRTQVSDAFELLHHGIRYLDVRLTFDDGWYTENTMISAPFREYAEDVIRFLQANSGELIIFDLNDVRLGAFATFNQLWDYMATISINGQTLFDFVHITPYSQPIYELTLYDATNGGSSAGIIMFARTATNPADFHYFRDATLRSHWHEQRNTDGLVERVAIEHEYLLLGNHDQLLRINQAMISPALAGSELVNSVLGWGYLRINERHNAQLAINPNIEDWLGTMPILKVGFSDSSRGDFNELIIERINAFNRGLN